MFNLFRDGPELFRFVEKPLPVPEKAPFALELSITPASPVAEGSGARVLFTVKMTYDRAVAGRFRNNVILSQVDHSDGSTRIVQLAVGQVNASVSDGELRPAEDTAVLGDNGNEGHFRRTSRLDGAGLFEFTLNSGVYEFFAEYPGDSNFRSAKSEIVRYQVTR